jgi:hypothetical protein
MAKKKKRVARKPAKSKKKAAPLKKSARHPRTRREAPQLEAAPLSKLDPMLRLGARRAKKEARGTESIAPGGCPSSIRDLSIGIHSLASRMSQAGAERLQKEDLVSVVIDCRPGASVRERVDEWGGCGTRVTDSTVVARVPRTELEALARLPAVRYVEASTKLKLHSDLAHVSSGLVRAGARTVPQTGTGVLVGVVDTGIDMSHPAFQSGGKTRIVSYLDQFTDQEFDSAKIDAGDAAASTDTVGHGTHVAGIAAGNGGGSPASSLKGVAPEADLAVVKSTLAFAILIALWQVVGQLTHFVREALAIPQPQLREHHTLLAVFEANR